MTYTYRWSAFTEADLLSNGMNGTDFGYGDRFVMPSSATVQMATVDDDGALQGDNGWFADDKSEDWYGQEAYVNNCRVGGKMFAEQYHVLTGSDGKTYHLIEIKIEGHDSAGAGNGYFTFYGAVPPAGVTLTVTQTCNVTGSWVDYCKLGANPPQPAPGCITGRLTVDANYDNTENNGAGGYDAGLGGRTVQLLNAAGTVVATTTTDASGNYSFNVAAGQYVVKFPQLAGYQFAQQGVGAAAENSDANASGLTNLVTVGSGQTVANIDASVQVIKTNAAPVFTNAPNDPFCVTENTKTVIDLNATDADCDTLTYKIVGGDDAGKFTINASTGVLSFVAAPDFEAPGSKDGDNTYSVIVAVDDGRGGVTNKALTVNVCNDPADDSPTCTIIEAEDMVLCGYTVKCANSASGGEYVSLSGYNGYVQTTFAGTAGQYDLTLRHYDQVGSGSIKVVVNGTVVKTISLNADNNQWNEVNITGISLKAGDVIRLETSGVDCEYAIIDSLKICPVAPKVGALEGRVFVDANKDGIDNNEAGVAGVTVQLLDSTGKVVGTTTTAADGGYQFTNLPAGGYTVAFPTVVNGRVLTTQNVGANDTIDSDANVSTGRTDAVTVVAGQTTKDVDAGVKDPGTASLEGRAFVDANKDGIDNNEAGVAGQTVQLVNAAGAVIDTTVTAADGSYKFANLDAGTYSVRFPTSADGKVLTAQNVGANDTVDSDANTATGTTGSYVVNIGDAVKDVDAGYKDPGTAALAGRAFVDANRDGIDNNEAGVAGQTVQLLDVSGNVFRTTTTAADGSYEFTGLDAGTYSVRFPTSADGRVLTGQNVGANDAIDSDANTTTGVTGTYTVPLGQRVNDVDAGYKDPGTAAIGDRVWLDTDRDGIQDANETGAAGVTVTLFDASGAAVDTTTTNASGNYLFSGLTAGTYSVGFGTLAGLTYTTANAGNDTLDSDANVSTGRTGSITLALDEKNLTVDAGLISINKAPVAQNDAATTCADERKTVNVLANDSDPDGNGIVITSVAGQSISDLQTITTASGVKITLAGGQLVVDGEAAYASLDIGQKATESFTYTISDGLGGTATATLDMTFCGDANSVESFVNALPNGTITYKIQASNVVAPVEDYAYDIQLVTTGQARLDGDIFTAAYCLDRGAPFLRAETLEAAPVVTGTLIGANEAAAAGVFDPDQFSFFNGQSAASNLDLISWIMNQDYANDPSGRFNDWEVQRAIWELTNSDDLSFLDGVSTGFGQDADVNFILAQAAANGEGFQAGVGDIIAVVIDPGDSNPNNLQPFVIGMKFEAYDCLCA